MHAHGCFRLRDVALRGLVLVRDLLTRAASSASRQRRLARACDRYVRGRWEGSVVQELLETAGPAETAAGRTDGSVSSQSSGQAPR